MLIAVLLLPNIASATIYRTITQGYSPEPAPLSYTNETGNVIEYVVEYYVDGEIVVHTWFRVTPTTGLLYPDWNTSVNLGSEVWFDWFVLYEYSSLPPGVHTGTIRLRDKYNGAITYYEEDIVLNVLPANIEVDPPSLSINMRQGDNIHFTNAISVTNTGNVCVPSSYESCYLPFTFGQDSYSGFDFGKNINNNDPDILWPSYSLPDGGIGFLSPHVYGMPLGMNYREIYINSLDTSVTVPINVRVVNSTCVDYDDDGFFGYEPAQCAEGLDCNDDAGDPKAPNINPDAEEISNDGIDNDCDGEVDEADCPGGFENCNEEPNADLGGSDGFFAKGGGGGYSGGGGYGKSCGSPVWDVNMITLNHFMTDTPLWLGSPIGPSIGITLSYNSKDDASGNGPFGNRWVFGYGGHVEEDPGGDVTVFMPDGAQHVYTSDGQNGYIAPQGKLTTLVKINDNDFRLDFLDGSAYVYQIPQGTSLTQPHLVQMIDAYGQMLTFGYDSGGGLETITDAIGRDITLEYNAGGHIANVLDPFNRSAYFEYDLNGNLTKITDMGQYWTSFTYDEAGYLSGMTNERGSWSFDTEPSETYQSGVPPYPAPWDAMSTKYRITVSDPQGGKEEYFYTSRDNPGDELSTWHVSPNDYVEYESESVNNLTSAPKTKYVIPERTLQNDVIERIYYPNEVEANASYESFGYYQTNGKIANGTDIHGHQNHYTYNDKGLVNSVTYPNGETVTYGYDPNGVDVTSITTGLGTATFDYNSNHSIVNATDMEGITTSFSYNEFGQVTSVTGAVGTPDETVTEYIYNESHFIDERRINGETVATSTYNNIGLVNSVTDASGITLSYDYDDLNQIKKTTYPDGKFIWYEYETCCPGQIKSVTDRSGRTTYYRYDNMKRLVEVNSPGDVTRYEYDKNGNVTKLTDTSGNETHFEYDLMDRLIRKTYADTKYDTLDTDDSGLILNTVGAGGVTATFGYNNMDMVNSVDYSDATPDVTLTYDSYGRVESRTDGAGTFGYAYYADSTVQSVDGPWANDTVSYTYDNLGRVKTLTPEGGQTITYTYDSLGRTETIQFGTDTFTYSYTGSSPLVTGITRPNGNITDYAYNDPLKRLTNVTNWKNTNKTKLINIFDYTYNDQDLRDNETVTNGEPITSFIEGLTTYNHNNVNQMTDSDGTTGPRTYTHDDDGGMTQGYTPEGYPFTATYDAEDRLISISYTDSGSVVHETHYTYGADGLLYQIRKVDGGTESITRIVRAGFLPIQERDGNDNIIREYVWGPSMGGGIGGLLAMKEGNNVYQYIYDGKGNVTALTASNGNVVAAYSYDPFGVVTEAAGSIDQPFRFSTKRYDEQTGLSYYGYRFYSASLGRWLSRDPLGEAGGMNLYGFVGNNAINGIDPLGLLTVYYWEPGGESKNDKWYGHVSIKLEDGTYISYWPDRSLSGKLGGVFDSTAPRTPSYELDKRDERGSEPISIDIYGLDEVSIRLWWNTVNHGKFSAFNNCSDTVSEALRQGGLSMPEHLIYHPEQVYKDIQRTIVWDYPW